MAERVQVNVRVPVEVARAAKDRAWTERRSFNAFVIEAIREKLKRPGRPPATTANTASA